MLTDIQKGLAERRAKTRRDDEIREEIFDRFDIKTEGLSDLSEEALAEMMLKLGGIAIDTADEARNKPPEMFVHFVPIPRRSNARWQYGMMQIGAQHNTGDKTIYHPAVVVEVRWATDQMDSATRQPNEDAIIHVATNDIKRGYLIGKAIAGGDEGVRALVIGDTREALARGFVIPTDATEDQKATIDKKLDEAVEKDLAGTFTLQDGTVRTQLEQRWRPASQRVGHAPPNVPQKGVPRVRSTAGDTKRRTSRDALGRTRRRRLDTVLTAVPVVLIAFNRRVDWPSVVRWRKSLRALRSPLYRVGCRRTAKGQLPIPATEPHCAARVAG
jgi:hypothetical protein